MSMGFPGSSESKESACNMGDLGLISGSGRAPGEGNGNPLKYSWLENSMDRGSGRLQSMGSQRVRQLTPRHSLSIPWISVDGAYTLFSFSSTG